MDEKICVKCNFVTADNVPNCPRCRTGTLQSRSTLRVLGGVLVALGLLLIGIMSIVTILVTGAITGDGSVRFRGSDSDMMFMVSVFGVVFLFGLTALIAGLWQVVFGRRNKVIIWLMLGLGGLFFLAGQMVAFMD